MAAPDVNSENIVFTDQQSGVSFELVPESVTATCCAILSVMYMLLAMCGFLWLMNDTFSNHHHFLRRLCSFEATEKIPPTLSVLMSAFIGGALGGIVNELRSFLTWHAERKAFGTRFIWKGITAPWVGGSLALFAVAIVTSGISILGANFESPQDGTKSALAVFAIGAMAGYGSREASKWLDAQVKRVFSVEVTTTAVPDILNKTRDEAERLLIAAGLKLGVVTDENRPADTRVDIVIKQSPAPGSTALVGSSVNCAISRR